MDLVGYKWRERPFLLHSELVLALYIKLCCLECVLLAGNTLRQLLLPKAFQRSLLEID